MRSISKVKIGKIGQFFDIPVQLWVQEDQMNKSSHVSDKFLAFHPIELTFNALTQQLLEEPVFRLSINKLIKENNVLVHNTHRATLNMFNTKSYTIILKAAKYDKYKLIKLNKRLMIENYHHI
jgi:hypothetical protein